MTLTPRIVAETIRQKLQLPASAVPQITYQIPAALKACGRKIAADPTTRPLLTTDKTSVKLSIALGKVDLSTLYTTHKAIKEFIELGQMYHLPAYSFAAASVSAAADTITLAADERLAVGDIVRFTSTGSVPTGISLATDYYVRTSALNVITLSASPSLTPLLDITATGSGTHTVTVQESADFPLQKLQGAALAPFPRALDSMFRYYYIQGDKLHTLPAHAAGQVAFAVPYYPATLALLPESEEAEFIFLSCLEELVAMAQGGAK